MDTYSVRGFTAATVATANHAVCQLWNPDTAKRIKLLEFGLWRGGITGPRFTPRRTTARGTAGSTVTPDADNAWSGDDIPPSGALLDLAAFSVQPTLGGRTHGGFFLNAVTGSTGFGFVWATAKGIWIPPGEGFAIVQETAAVTPTSEVYFVWEE